MLGFQMIPDGHIGYVYVVYTWMHRKLPFEIQTVKIMFDPNI